MHTITVWPLFLFYCFPIFSQQPVPVELVAKPEAYSFALSGSLLGNVDKEEIDAATNDAQASGRVFLDANLTPRLFTSIHINAVQNKNYRLDSAGMAGLSFAHNNYRFNVCIAYRSDIPVGYYNIFGDYSISSATYQKTTHKAVGSMEFTTYKINLGLQFMWEAEWDQHLIVHGSIKVNRMWIEDPPGDRQALEKVFKHTGDQPLARVYNGFSLKTTIQLNNISIYCETQNNYNAEISGHRSSIPSYTKHTYYSIGLTTTSTAILGKRKEGKKAPDG